MAVVVFDTLKFSLDWFFRSDYIRQVPMQTRSSDLFWPGENKLYHCKACVYKMITGTF